jgi:hypothetical protein
MNLSTCMDLYLPAIVGGGEGSGCNPEVGKCGRPPGSGKGVGTARPYAQKLLDLQKSLRDSSSPPVGWAGAGSEKYIFNTEYSGAAKDVVKGYLTEAGISDKEQSAYFQNLESWQGFSDNQAGLRMRAVAQDYYGRDWSTEWSKGTSLPRPDEDKLRPIRSAMMAMKSLCQAYCELEGAQTVYRGITVSPEMKSEIKKARKAGAAQEVEIGHNSLDSWSLSKLKFGNVGVKMRVDPANVWAYYKITPWIFSVFPSEREIVVGHRSPVGKYSGKDIELK